MASTLEQLRSVADRGDEDAREIFGDATKAVEDYGDPEQDEFDHEPTAAEVVEQALAYRPIEL